MTMELKKITKRIDAEFLKYFYRDLDMETIFVVGSMANDDYQDRMGNDYDIRIICKKVNPNKINNFEQYVEALCKRISNENLFVTCSTLDGPINYPIQKSQKKLIIHAIIYTPEQINNLSLPNKYQYGNKYRLVYGKDYLKNLKNIKYTLDDIVKGSNGLNYCLNMLKKRKNQYYAWDTKDGKSEYSLHTTTMTNEMIIEACFYAVNTLIDNLINYCNFNNYDIPQSKMIFCIKLLGQANINENTIFLLQGLFTRSESILKAIFANPLKETIELLETIKLYIYHLDSLFSKKESNDKSKTMIKK